MHLTCLPQSIAKHVAKLLVDVGGEVAQGFLVLMSVIFAWGKKRKRQTGFREQRDSNPSPHVGDPMP